MIAKKGRAGGKGSGFRKLARYTIGEKEKGQRARQGMEALSGYILDQQRHSGRVAWHRITNCAATDVHQAMTEIVATQAKNTRAQGDKSYHLIVSFPPGERPSREQIEDIEDQLVEALGMGEHQRISGLHTDTDCLHLHVAINRVRPETLRVAQTRHDYAKLGAAATELEIKHGLFRTAHGLTASRGRRPTRAADMEAHQRRESFASWVERVAKAELVEAAIGGAGWQALHDAARRHGLIVKPRGAGLVLAHRDEPALMVKPSTLDRSLGAGMLARKWGRFTADMTLGAASSPPSPAGAVPAAGQGASPPAGEAVYHRPSLDRAPQGADLWAAYEADRRAVLERRETALDALQEKHADYLDKLAAHYAAQWHVVKHGRQLAGIDARVRAQALKADRAKAMAAFKAQAGADRQAIYDDHQAPGWLDWLRGRAEAGDVEAVAALRRMDNRLHNFTQSMIRVPDEAIGKVLVATSRNPRAGRNGEITYKVGDGGIVVDEEREIKLPGATRAAALLALSLAKERFGDQTVVVAGDEATRRALIEASLLPGAAVRFADPAMQAERDRLAATLRPAREESALDRFIRAQNRWPDPKDRVTYRAREPGDQGNAVFVGIRALDDRHSAALWRQGDTVLVEEITPANRAILRDHRAGEGVTLSRLDGTTAQSHTTEPGQAPTDERGIDL